MVIAIYSMILNKIYLPKEKICFMKEMNLIYIDMLNSN